MILLLLLLRFYPLSITIQAGDIKHHEPVDAEVWVDEDRAYTNSHGVVNFVGLREGSHHVTIIPADEGYEIVNWIVMVPGHEAMVITLTKRRK